MKARDIMTTPVVCVTPETPVREIAELLYERRISGVPVVEGGRLVGLVSEADLMRRHEIGTDRAKRRGSWWLRFFASAPSPEDYVKSHAQRARDIMSADVATVAPETPVSDIAALLESRGIKRVPVVEDDHVVGIVSRSNLVRALAVSVPPREKAPESDEAVRASLLAELERQPWWSRQPATNVIVSDGVVHLWGTYDQPAERDAARVAAENTPGVRRIEDHRVRLTDLPSSV